MKKRFISIPMFGICACLFQTACQVDDYYLNDFSTDSVIVSTAVGAPLASISLTLKQLLQHDGLQGSIITEQGDYGYKEHGLDNNIPLPLYALQGTTIKSNDTVEDANFEDYLGEGKTVSDFSKIILKINAKNGLPFQAHLLLHFLDENGLFINDASLRREIDVASANVGSDGKPSSATENNYAFEFTGDDIPSLRKTKQIKVEYDFSIPEDREYVYADSSYTIDLKMKAYVNGDILVSEIGD